MTQNATTRIAIASSVSALLIFGAYLSRPQAPHPETVVCEPSPLAYTATAPADTNEAIDETSTISADDHEKQVREATIKFIKEKYPNSKIDGVFTLAFGRGNLYIAGADTITGENRRTIDLLVRRYVRRNGGEYWRAESLSEAEAEVWMKKIQADTTDNE